MDRLRALGLLPLDRNLFNDPGALLDDGFLLAFMHLDHALFERIGADPAIGRYRGDGARR